jgi:hypothetical protein
MFVQAKTHNSFLEKMERRVCWTIIQGNVSSTESKSEILYTGRLTAAAAEENELTAFLATMTLLTNTFHFTSSFLLDRKSVV